MANGTKRWSATDRADWSDFQGSPDSSKPDRDAETTAGYRADPQVSHTKKSSGNYEATIERVDTETYLDRSESWVRDGEQSDALLNHEQGHFDLKEVQAREVKDDLEGLSGEGSTKRDAYDELDEKMRDRVSDIDDKYDKLDKRYDQETDKGTDPQDQQSWDEAIDRGLRDRELPDDTSVEDDGDDREAEPGGDADPGGPPSDAEPSPDRSPNAGAASDEPESPSPESAAPQTDAGAGREQEPDADTSGSGDADEPEGATSERDPRSAEDPGGDAGADTDGGDADTGSGAEDEPRSPEPEGCRDSSGGGEEDEGSAGAGGGEVIEDCGPG